MIEKIPFEFRTQRLLYQYYILTHLVFINIIIIVVVSWLVVVVVVVIVVVLHHLRKFVRGISIA